MKEKSLQQHLDANRARIEEWTRAYAKRHSCDIGTARQEVEDEIAEGFYEAQDSADDHDFSMND